MLETENAKIRRSDVIQPFLNSTTINPYENINSESVINNTQPHQNNIMGEMNETFRNFTRTLESNKNNSKLNIKRDYQLTQEVVLNV